VAALEAVDIGHLFRLITLTGVSQQRIGIDVDMAQGRVSDIRNGKTKVEQFDVIRRIADGLRMPDHARLTLGLAPATDSRDAEDARVRRRDFMAGTLATGAAVAGAAVMGDRSAAAQRPDGSTAGHLAGLVHIVRQEDDLSPTGSLLGVSGNLLGLAEQWIAGARPQHRRDVGRAAAEAALLYWWLTVDAGLDGAVARDHATALAVEWETPALIGHMFGWRAGLALGDGHLSDAVELARRARESRWGMSPGAIGWASNYEARAQALLGDADGLSLALDVSQEAHEAVDLGAEPPWMYWLGDMLELNILDLRLLREGPDAAPAMNEALAAYPADRARDVAWYRAHVASARVWAGDVEGALADAEEAGRLSAATGTNWTMGELAQIARAPHLGELREVLADTAA
jgi:transcriptional regulator with XRE-family HTH domain